MSDTLQRADEQARAALSTGAGDNEAVVLALDAIRLTMLAALEPDIAEEDPGVWCRLELFGHSLAYGLVREVERYGRRWLALTVPEIRDGDTVFEEKPAKLYHPNAVYALDERPEDEVMEALRRQHGIFPASAPFFEDETDRDDDL